MLGFWLQLHWIHHLGKNWPLYSTKACNPQTCPVAPFLRFSSLPSITFYNFLSQVSFVRLFLCSWSTWKAIETFTSDHYCLFLIFRSTTDSHMLSTNPGILQNLLINILFLDFFGFYFYITISSANNAFHFWLSKLCTFKSPFLAGIHGAAPDGSGAGQQSCLRDRTAPTSGTELFIFHNYGGCLS